MNAVYKNGKVYYRDGWLNALRFVRYMDKTDYKIQRDEFLNEL